MGKFSNDQNIMYTNQLFKEMNTLEPDLALYTLAADDITEESKTYVSLRKQYLLLEDPTEYEIASRYFESWTHWKKVRESAKIKPHVDEWREELETKLKSRGVKGIMAKSDDGDYQSHKYLAEKGWIKGTRKPGAPTKAEIVSEVRKAAKTKNVVNLHYDRMKMKER